MVTFLQSVIECVRLDGDRSAVRQELLNNPGVSVTEDRGSALVAKHSVPPIDHSMPLAGLCAPHFASRSQAETLFGATLRLHFGHFASFHNSQM
jgi:hypothetical protein